MSKNSPVNSTKLQYSKFSEAELRLEIAKLERQDSDLCRVIAKLQSAHAKNYKHLTAAKEELRIKEMCKEAPNKEPGKEPPDFSKFYKDYRHKLEPASKRKSNRRRHRLTKVSQHRKKSEKNVDYSSSLTQTISNSIQA